tara:strand:- start:24165 stop:24473 length:309 start_codon:yes stop_codon:yes gene_type:complete
MRRETLKPLWWRILVSVDNLCNVLLSAVPSLRKKGFGYTDETVSSVIGKRYYYHHDRSWFILIIYKPIEMVDRGHFKRYIEHDEGFEVIRETVFGVDHEIKY